MTQPTIAVLASRIRGLPAVWGWSSLAASGATGLIAPEASTVHSLPDPSAATTRKAPIARSSVIPEPGTGATTQPASFIDVTVGGASLKACTTPSGGAATA